MSFRWMEKAERRDFPQGKDPLSLVRKEHSVKELTVSAGKGSLDQPRSETKDSYQIGLLPLYFFDRFSLAFQNITVRQVDVGRKSSINQ